MSLLSLMTSQAQIRSQEDEPVHFVPPQRNQANVLAARERDVLRWLCRRLPDYIQPDHLTALGFFGMVIAGAGYVLSNWYPAALVWSSFGLVVNWFGDSLDGTLARYRNEERPRYGYFLDHSVDAFGTSLLLFGLGAVPSIGPLAALFALVGYLLISIYSFLSCHVSGTLHLAFFGCGPSEMRLALILLNTVMSVWGPANVMMLGHTFSLYSLAVGFFGLLFIGVFIFQTIHRIHGLCLAETPRFRTDVKADDC